MIKLRKSAPPKVIRIKRTPHRIVITKSTPKAPIEAQWYSIHSHSKFSVADALPEVEQMVAQAKTLGYKGLGLTDHGNVAGSVRLYMACKKAGIKPFPGSELYVVYSREDKTAKRYHMGVVAFSEEGYRNLVNLSTLSHTNFHHKPLLDLADLSQLADEGKLKGLAVTTGCFFGMVTQRLIDSGYEAAKLMVATLG
jgi:DNA polymerase-3 subunit alpha